MYLLCRNIYLSPRPFLNCAIYYLFVVEFQNTGYLITSLVLLRLPWWLTVKHLPAVQGMRVPGSGRFGEGNGNPLHILPGESHGQRRLVGCSPRGHKSQEMIQRLNQHTTQCFLDKVNKHEEISTGGILKLYINMEDSLEKEMATHSSTLAWKIPWTEERGRLQSMGLQRVRHN